MLIDSHCHLDSEKFELDLEQVIQRAQENGVLQFVTIGTDFQSSQQAVTLSKRFPGIYASVGVHPHKVKNLDSETFLEGSRLTDHPNVVAIGETGLDYFYKHSSPEQQIHWFREQIRLARTRRLPLVIHSRDAKEETLLILEEEKAFEVGGVLHCFTGDQEMAKRGMELGFYISFSGIVTFSKATEVQEVARKTPMDKILIETDCPFLAPVPFRGKRNEPVYVRSVAKKIAELKEMTLEEISMATSNNAQKLFGIK